jgi:methylated-DNA-[protein]-cysteine S-methyltransferase
VSESALEAALAVDIEAMRRLHERLALAAATDGVLDVAYRTLSSPVGDLLIAATPVGLVRVAFARQGLESVLAVLAARVSPRMLEAPARLDSAARELGEYFAGRRTTFDVTLDLRLATGFRRQVLDRLPSIPYGSTASYAVVAGMTDSPGAVRAVGTACALNPLPLVLPCHRVVRSDGAPGEYVGGAEAKLALLTLEAAQ